MSSLLVLSNCSKPEQPVTNVVVSNTFEVKQKPEQVQMSSVKFKVVTKDNIEAFIKEISTSGDYVFIAMSVKDYENLAFNFDQLRRYVEQQNSIIVYYEGFANG